MKLTTSFIPARANPAPWLAVAGAALGVLLCVAAFGLIAEARDMAREESVLRERLAEIEARRRAAQAFASLPAPGELAALRERVTALNAMTAGRGAPTPILLAALERLLPDNAWFVSFHHRAREGEVTLVAESADAAPLATFLKRLEAEPRFATVLLTRQSAPSAGGGVQFELKLKEAP
jgi:Tfp pilus assembly protein PilN